MRLIESGKVEIGFPRVGSRNETLNNP
jgi:hypothetical protein